MALGAVSGRIRTAVWHISFCSYCCRTRLASLCPPLIFLPCHSASSCWGHFLNLILTKPAHLVRGERSDTPVPRKSICLRLMQFTRGERDFTLVAWMSRTSSWVKEERKRTSSRPETYVRLSDTNHGQSLRTERSSLVKHSLKDRSRAESFVKAHSGDKSWSTLLPGNEA